jgi:hypothetical protein
VDLRKPKLAAALTEAEALAALLLLLLLPVVCELLDD